MGSCVQLMVVMGIMGAYVFGISILFFNSIYPLMKTFTKGNSILDGPRMTVLPNFDHSIDIKRSEKLFSVGIKKYNLPSTGLFMNKALQFTPGDLC